MSAELQQFCFSQVGLHVPENLENTISGRKNELFPQELCTKKSLQGCGHLRVRSRGRGSEGVGSRGVVGPAEKAL